MKIYLILILLLGIAFLPLSYADSYWGNLKVDVEKSERLEGEKSDVIRIKTKITNNDKEEISIYYSYVVLDDSKHREFSHSNYYELRNKGHNITERDCPWEFYLDLNPGISEDANFCYEVPKENVEYTLHFYESSLDWCKNPSWGGCQEKTVRLIVNPPSPKSSYVPPSSGSTIPKNIEINPNITRDITISSGSGSPECEDTNSCYVPSVLTIGKRSTVVWYNVDNVAHTITSGTPSKGPSEEFDSSLLMSGKLFSVKFNSEGTYPYYCVVHPWMTGQIVVKRNATIVGDTPQLIPKDFTPPKILKPTDIVVDAESTLGTKVTYQVLTIDDVDTIIRPSCNPNSGSLFAVGQTKVICNAMDSSGNRAIPISFTVTVNSPKTVIPNWVKNVASFWCENSIDDGSFIEGIQYLINNKVIVVSTQSGVSNSQEIPQWVKNNACWWSKGSISDSEFASGIEFLVKQGIIRV